MRKIIVLLIAAVAQLAAAAEDKAPTSHSDYLIGVYYFAGWWQKSPNKWETGGREIK